MKNILLSIITILFFGCANNSNNDIGTDSANAIEDHPLQDTQVSPNPDGYAIPNAKIDTSEHFRDSLDSIKH